MAMRTSGEGSRFAVDLGDVKLPSIVEKRVEAEIQAVVLRVLAETDLGGRSRLEDLIVGRFPDGTAGMILTAEAGGGWLPWMLPGVPSREPLTVEDHTLIVQAIMERPFEVIQYLDKAERTSDPSPTAVLEAALQVGQIDPYTKDRIRAVLAILPKLEDARKNAPAELQRTLDELRERLAGRPIDEQISTLRNPRSSYREQEGLAVGMDFAARMLEHGRSTIYSPEFSFYRTLREGKRGRVARRPAVDDIKDADTFGAVAGGAVGLFVGGIGAAPGAAGSAAAASAGYAVGSVINWLFFE